MTLFYLAFRDRYLDHIECFNELGRCFVGGDVGVVTEGGMVWGVFAFVFACLAAITFVRLGFAIRRAR